jgi:hypothetical protein
VAEYGIIHVKYKMLGKTMQQIRKKATEGFPQNNNDIRLASAI